MNLVNTLYQVYKFGLMMVKELRGIIIDSNMEKCKNYVHQSWYDLLAPSFTKLIFQVSSTLRKLFIFFLSIFNRAFMVFVIFYQKQEISAAGDVAVRAYREQTGIEDITDSDIALAMLTGMKEKIGSLKIKLGKLKSIANPIYGDKVFQGVRSNYSFIIMKCKYSFLRYDIC